MDYVKISEKWKKPDNINVASSMFMIAVVQSTVWKLEEKRFQVIFRNQKDFEKKNDTTKLKRETDGNSCHYSLYKREYKVFSKFH